MQRKSVLAWTTIAILTLGLAHTATAQDGAEPLADFTQHSGDYIALPPGGVGTATVTCPSGTQPTGGGYRTSAFDIQVTDSAADGFGWVAIGRNNGAETQELRATVICTIP